MTREPPLLPAVVFRLADIVGADNATAVQPRAALFGERGDRLLVAEVEVCHTLFPWLELESISATGSHDQKSIFARGKEMEVGEAYQVLEVLEGAGCGQGGEGNGDEAGELHVDNGVEETDILWSCCSGCLEIVKEINIMLCREGKTLYIFESHCCPVSSSRMAPSHCDSQVCLPKRVE